MVRVLGWVGGVLLLTACAHPVAPPAPAVPTFDAPSVVRAIRASGAAAAGELDVQPLRDTAVEDLRQQASGHEREGRLDAAAASLDQALALRPDDAAVLQERAEVALLAGDIDAAAAHATRAATHGTDVGPLCRRHQETLRQLAVIRGDAAAAKGAAARRDACTVAGPARY